MWLSGATVRNESLNAHAIWQMERGFKYPVVRPPQIRVVFVSGSALTSEEASLLGKMITAMKLPSELVRICEKSDQNDLRNIDLTIVLGEEAAQVMELTGEHWAEQRGCSVFVPRLDTKILVTFHPRDLLRNPNQKRQAWNDLQEGMRVLGLL
jgi:hypothetical protein